jgi:hypothetical protein
MQTIKIKKNKKIRIVTDDELKRMWKEGAILF